MRSLVLITFFSFPIFLNSSCDQKDYETYTVNKTEHKITIDGQLSEKAWSSANVITEFQYPWEPEWAQPTTFRALYDDDFLYLGYQMEDDIIIAPDLVTDEQDLIEQDRVEIYVAADKTMREYFCIEMDVKGRKLDYKGKFHRQFDFTWQFEAMDHKGIFTDKGYQVEAAISLNALRDLGVINDASFIAGVYRADFHYGQDSSVVHVYATWLNPSVDEPDFHVPASLGKFRLSK